MSPFQDLSTVRRRIHYWSDVKCTETIKSVGGHLSWVGRLRRRRWQGGSRVSGRE